MEHLDNVSGTLLKDGTEALFGFARVFQASDEVGVLLRDFFAGLRFVFGAAKGLKVSNSRKDFGRRNPEQSLDTAWSVFRSGNIEVRGISILPRQDSVER